MLYGSDYEVEDKLREWSGGRLKVEYVDTSLDTITRIPLGSELLTKSLLSNWCSLDGARDHLSNNQNAEEEILANKRRTKKTLVRKLWRIKTILITIIHVSCKETYMIPK